MTSSYRDAGVDLAAADAHVNRIGPAVQATWNESVVGGFGGFAAGVEIPKGYENPVLMMCTDGVGTKLDLARQTDTWSGVGRDLVAMSVDDLAAAGAKPLGFVDYMAVGSLRPERDQAIVESVAAACREAGCPLLGGETAEHPGVMQPDSVDLAGAAIGIVERQDRIGPHRVQAGDLVVGLSSPNLRSNGFSLVRRVFAGVDLDRALPGFDRNLGDILLSPSVIYAPAVMEATATGGVRAGAHVTGGGLQANLDRAVPDGMRAVVDHWSWEWPQIFVELQRRGGVSVEDMRSTFNLGIGFCLVVDPSRIDAVAAVCDQHHPTVIGRIE